MKILGIDYGLKRIGIAVSDDRGIMAFPLVTIENRGDKKNISAISELVKKHGVSSIMFGIPQDVVGEDTTMTRIIREFGEKLAIESGLEVVYFNERYSSKDAEDHIRENLGVTNHRKIAELVDKMAAAMILSDYIKDKQK
ncbi:MAG: Holliday junction resolvase RuvX [Firmicutes bacterium]|nr:Holliday junction resolvase RuvX [Bacillota bacterium]